MFCCLSHYETRNVRFVQFSGFNFLCDFATVQLNVTVRDSTELTDALCCFSLCHKRRFFFCRFCANMTQSQFVPEIMLDSQCSFGQCSLTNGFQFSFIELFEDASWRVLISMSRFYLPGDLPFWTNLIEAQRNRGFFSFADQFPGPRKRITKLSSTGKVRFLFCRRGYPLHFVMQNCFKQTILVSSWWCPVILAQKVFKDDTISDWYFAAADNRKRV